jgi:hypothetical protein
MFQGHKEIPKQASHRLNIFTFTAHRNGGKEISNLFSLSFLGVEQWTFGLANIA